MEIVTEMVQVHALGPLRLRRDRRDVPLGGRAQQAVLARLFVGYPAPVSVDALVEAVWADDPPAQGLSTVQAYVSRLRRLLAPGFAVRKETAGYRLVAEGGRLDVELFGEAVQQAERAAAAERWAEVVGVLTPALADWRSGAAFAPFATEPWALDVSERLDARRTHARETLARAYLELQAPAEALEVLEVAISEHPYAESLVRLQMIALYRDGRATEAIEHFHRFRAALDDELGLEPSRGLHELLRDLLAQAPGLDWSPPATSGLPRLLPPRNRMLVGRDALLAKVERKLALTGALTLHGLPGVGKTSVATELAHRQPGLVCWVPAEDATSALRALTELAVRLGVSPMLAETELLQHLWARLDDHPGWLLVFDNADRADHVRALLPPLSSGRVLITSRNPAWSWLGPTCKVEPLADDAATELIVRRTRRRGEDPAPLVRAMSGLALALEQACSYIDETGMSLERYVQLFTRRHRDILSRGAPEDHPHPVTATWGMVVDDIAARSPLAVRLLEICSFLSSDDLTLELLDDLVGDHPDELEVEDAISELVRYSMVDREGSTLRLHRLVQEVVRSRLAKPDMAERAAAAARALVLRTAPRPGWTERGPDWAALAQHALAVVRAALAADLAVIGLAPVVLDCAHHLRARLVLEPAHELVDLALELVERTSPRELVTLGELRTRRADILDAEGRLTEAQAAVEAGLACFQRSPTVVPDLVWARAWSLQGHVLNCADQPSAAAAAYRRALAVLIREDATEELAEARIGLGYTLWSARDYSGAERQFRAALEGMADPVWAVHPLHPEGLSGLAMMLHEQDLLDEAVALQRQALAETEQLYGAADHPALAYIHDKLGWELRLLGDAAEAQAQHAVASGMLERLFGADDARLAMMLSNLGLAQADAGLAEAALSSQQRAAAILIASYGAEHRDTKLVSARLATLGQGDDPLAPPGHGSRPGRLPQPLTTLPLETFTATAGSGEGAGPEMFAPVSAL